MSDDFFSADESGNAATYEANEASIRSRKRRRTKVIALVALGSVGALGIFSCASSQTDDTWQGADSGQVVDGAGVNGTATQADGTTPVASRGYRPSIWPWMWFLSSNRGYGGSYGGRAPAGGYAPTSGFSGSTTSSTAAAPRAPSTSTGGSSTSGTSRSGFGTIGSALSGVS